LDMWFENVETVKVRPFSHQSYRGYIDNHTAPNIGNLPIEELTTMELQKFYRKLLSNGRVERKKMQTVPAEQLQPFLGEARNTGVYEMYYIELSTGLRRGKLPGLKWSIRSSASSGK